MSLVGAVRSAVGYEVSTGAVWEREFVAAVSLEDPWAEIQLDVEFTDPDGAVHRVPAFWAGGRSWRVRYSSRLEGLHQYRSAVRADRETGLEEQTGSLDITGYHGSNPLILHGAPVVAPDRRHLMHEDGTPFFWLADTWWSAMTGRFRWPETFQILANDRATKGFSVILVVAGLVPEFGLFSPLMASEGGQPWLNLGKGTINPHFYDVPDLKVDYLVGKGLLPCIVGGWGSWASVLGRDKILQHWRYLVARYGAYPVAWCIAGQAELPFPFAPVDGEPSEPKVVAYLRDVDMLSVGGKEQAALWEEASHLVHNIDPFKRIRTVHPTGFGRWSSSRTAFEAPDSFDLDLLQTGHTGWACIPITMERVNKSISHGDKPVINGECCYEGIGGSCWQDVQRFLFWSHVLSGTAGHTYGTMPISTFSSREDPFVPMTFSSSAHWEDAIQWSGAEHVGVGRRVLERLRWWELTPSRDAIEPHAGPSNWFLPYAASLPDGTLVIYVPGTAMATPETFGTMWNPKTIAGLTPGGSYTVSFVNPRTGKEDQPIHFTTSDGRKSLQEFISTKPAVFATNHPPELPTWEDWVLVVRPSGKVRSVSSEPW